MKTKAKRFLSMFLALLMVMSSWVFVAPVSAVEEQGNPSVIADDALVDTNKRLELNFNKNWKFHLGDKPNAKMPAFNDDSWREISLPHDFSIEQGFDANGTEAESGSIPGGVGWYRKTFLAPKSIEGKSIVLTFDGVYDTCEVFLNGQSLGKNLYGYNAFSFDLTDKVTCDGKTDNVIAVRVDNPLKTSRWYSGSGIYRDVTLTVTNPVHVALYGTKVTMPELESSGGKSGKLETVVTVENGSTSVKVNNKLYAPDGTMVNESGEQNLGADGKVTLTNNYNGELKLWSPEHPNLYTLVTEVKDVSGNLLDTYETKIGYRWTGWTKENGFYLNGENIKLKGVCMHHDQGALGAIQEYDALYRQMSILKDMGVNAVRTSHNCASRVLIDVCNELGLLVMEEFFDGWNLPKNENDNDFSKYFTQNINDGNNLIGASSETPWYKFVVERTVKRDRNDPSVFMWSVGNELVEGTNGSGFDENIGVSLANLLRQLDPSRPITHGNNKKKFPRESFIHADNVDSKITTAIGSENYIVGGNYNLSTWKTYNRDNPFVATETASSVNSRGVYNATGNGGNGVSHVSGNSINSYDDSFVSWGERAADAWYSVATLPWFSGEFVWTGFDYIGEPTPWNNQTASNGGAKPNSSYFGIIDTAGFGKDSYYLYRSLWNGNENTLHIVPGTWNRNNLSVSGDFVNVAVYSNAHRIELYLNNTLIGEATATEKGTAPNTYKTWEETPLNITKCTTNKFINGKDYSNGSELYAQFNVKYEEGTLSVKAFDSDGHEITESCAGLKEVKSGSASVLEAKLWKPENSAELYTADGDSYAYVEFEAQDEDGNFINDYNGLINISVEGNGVICGVDNGNQATTEKFQNGVVINGGRSAHINMFNGRALAIVRTTEKAGSVKVTASMENNQSERTVTFTAVPENDAEAVDEYEEAFPQIITSDVLSPKDRHDDLANKIGAEPENVSSNYTKFNYVNNVPDGNYIIYNQGREDKWYLENGFLQHDNKIKAGYVNANNFDRIEVSANNDTLSAESEHEFYFKKISDKYIIGNKQNQYILDDGQENISTTNNENQATKFTIDDYGNGRVGIHNGNRYFNSSGGEKKFILYGKSGKDNEKMTLFVPPALNKHPLWQAISDGLSKEITDYTARSYANLLNALELGMELYNSPDITTAKANAAAAVINDAINNLESKDTVTGVKKFDATLFKYGYDNSNGQKNYSDGGKLINQIAIKELSKELQNDPSLLSQIKKIIGYDDKDWNDSTEKQAAIKKVADVYAKIYTLQFTGAPVTGEEEIKYQSTKEGKATLDTDTSTFPPTAWNIWCKEHTEDLNDAEQGASVQGLAGTRLGSDKTLIPHEQYKEALPYSNITETGKSQGYDSTKFLVNIKKNGKNQTIELENLKDISPYSADIFRKETLDSNGNKTDKTEGKFSKYYWDTQFPFAQSGDESVKTYTYDSDDNNHIIRSNFDDVNHKVDMKLEEAGNWKLEKSWKPEGKGFFPFNYQEGADLSKIEKAIYHYGMTFTTNFSIPAGGHYKGAPTEDVIFNFTGDDDVYVYIDDVLVLDNGGIHGARNASINFSKQSVSYQYAMDVTEGRVKNPNVNNKNIADPVTYTYGATNDGISADNKAALDKLHQVYEGSDVHTFTFFYLERGSSDANCKINFNIQEISKDILLEPQSLVLDYGIPVKYNITDNNKISENAQRAGAKVNYIGIGAINTKLKDSAILNEKPPIIVPFTNNTLNINPNSPELEKNKVKMRGDFTMDKKGNIIYQMDNMTFDTGKNAINSDTIYVVAEIKNDPSSKDFATYYLYERITFVPASTIYYEDNFKEGSGVITYTDGTNNSGKDYGKWQTKGSAPDMYQAADIVGDIASNVYGHDYAYADSKEYSAGSAHYVEVSDVNNPYTHENNASWPEASFTFTGTGFDIISLTDNQSGAIEVQVYSGDTADGTPEKDYLIDTFYGYKFGKLYADEDGNPTLRVTDIPLYNSAKGKYTTTPMYKENNDPDFAYGWVEDVEATDNALYQIPILKLKDLTYGNYTVKIIPTFTNMFGHYKEDGNGSKYYGFYLDAIRIYDPAGKGEISDQAINGAYTKDKEKNADYLELRDMLIGANSFGTDSQKQGIIFIDGDPVCDNDIDKYKKAGPNNELYLAKGQAVSFEIWASEVPTDVQLGTKLVKGQPEVTLTVGTKKSTRPIATAADMYYNLNGFFSGGSTLSWTKTGDHYKTQNITVQNTGYDDSVLSVTDIKFTFANADDQGYLFQPKGDDNNDTSVETASAPRPLLFQNHRAMLMATPVTAENAMTAMDMNKADLTVNKKSEPVIKDGSAILYFTTSADVESLLIKDEAENTVTPEEIENELITLDGKEYKEWKVTLDASESGTYVYEITGVYKNGYIDESKSIKVLVAVEKTEELPEDSQTIFERIADFFRRLRDFFGKLLKLFGIR